VTNRREFLQAAAALSAVPLVGRAAFAGGRDAIGRDASGGNTVALDAIVFDTRHPEARAFSTRADRIGVPLRAIAGDITDLWLHDLRRRLSAEPIAIGGLTERPALFLLERLTWDHGLRVVFEAEHHPDGRGGAAHRLVRAATPGLAPALAGAGRNWPAVLADALIHDTGIATRDFRPTETGLAAHLGESMPLHSWIIAPRQGGLRKGRA
jgi:hypothetical protein